MDVTFVQLMFHAQSTEEIVSLFAISTISSQSCGFVSPPPPPAEKSIRERLETNVWFEENQYEKLPLHFVSFCILALFSVLCFVENGKC